MPSLYFDGGLPLASGAMSDEFPSHKLDKFVLRLPDGMRERIKRAADESGRSMNAEIVQLLEEAYPEDEPIEDILAGLQLGLAVVRKHGSRGGLNYIAEELKALVERLEGGNHFEGEAPEPRPNLNKRRAPRRALDLGPD